MESYFDSLQLDILREIFLKLDLSDLESIYWGEVLNGNLNMVHPLEDSYLWRIKFERLNIPLIGPLTYKYLFDGKSHDFIEYTSEYKHVRDCLFTAGDYILRKNSNASPFIVIKYRDITNMNAILRCMKIFNVDTLPMISEYMSGLEFGLSYFRSVGLKIEYENFNTQLVSKEFIRSLLFNMLYHNFTIYIKNYEYEVDIRSVVPVSKRLYPGNKFDE